MQETKFKLTEYAHGAGCGCKIAPRVLEEILASSRSESDFPALLVGNSSRDDAAVYKIHGDEALIATTDFFTPIVNDAFVFGKVAAANAISDVYAMGGEPLLALAILGWPVETLPATLAREVLEGARAICAEAGIPLCGGHSIDTKEPVFGLSVNGRVSVKNLKKNNTAQEGDVLLLTKPLGLGVLATAMKRGVIEDADLQTLYHQLTHLNKIGAVLGQYESVHAMTDVTGFGIAGHLIEMAEASGLSAILDYQKIPKLESVTKYLGKNILPDATYRNWNAYQTKIKLSAGIDTLEAFKLLPDPQTNGGLLIAVASGELETIQQVLATAGYEAFIQPFGKLIAREDKVLNVA